MSDLLPSNEALRIAALQELALLDTPKAKQQRQQREKRAQGRQRQPGHGEYAHDQQHAMPVEAVHHTPVTKAPLMLPMAPVKRPNS